MNYLAHLFLSADHEQQIVGNLMGDFVKGNHLKTFNHHIQQGVVLHRSIDKFTDSHAEVRGLKQVLSAQQRRYSGIIVDVVFDHFLAKHWLEFSPQPLAEFAQKHYQLLEKHQSIMPERMQFMVSKMISKNWLEGYQTKQAIAGALAGISRRIRFNNFLYQAHDEIMPAYDIYQQAFFSFFPQLQIHVSEQLEKSGNIFK